MYSLLGNFTNQGEGLSDRECIDKCCKKKSCDLAFMFADLCYSVECKNEDDCQAVVAKPSNLSPKVSFVSRTPKYSDRKFFIFAIFHEHSSIYVFIHGNGVFMRSGISIF